MSSPSPAAPVASGVTPSHLFRQEFLPAPGSMYSNRTVRPLFCRWTVGIPSADSGPVRPESSPADVPEFHLQSHFLRPAYSAVPPCREKVSPSMRLQSISSGLRKTDSLLSPRISETSPESPAWNGSHHRRSAAPDTRWHSPHPP